MSDEGIWRIWSDFQSLSAKEKRQLAKLIGKERRLVEWIIEFSHFKKILDLIGKSYELATVFIRFQKGQSERLQEELGRKDEDFGKLVDALGFTTKMAMHLRGKIPRHKASPESQKITLEIVRLRDTNRLSFGQIAKKATRQFGTRFTYRAVQQRYLRFKRDGSK